MPLHEIDPVFDKDSRVLLLGSFPSPKSREAGFYYAHPQNRMWKVLARVFGESFPETVEERKDFLHRNHVAMWDVIASCDITGASDTSIRNAVPNDLSVILSEAEIRAVFMTGAKAYELFRKYQEKNCPLPAYRLPSTSPANAACGEDFLAAAYLKVRLFALSDQE